MVVCRGVRIYCRKGIQNKLVESEQSRFGFEVKGVRD